MTVDECSPLHRVDTTNKRGRQPFEMIHTLQCTWKPYSDVLYMRYPYAKFSEQPLNPKRLATLLDIGSYMLPLCLRPSFMFPFLHSPPKHSFTAALQIQSGDSSDMNHSYCSYNLIVCIGEQHVAEGLVQQV